MGYKSHWYVVLMALCLGKIICRWLGDKLMPELDILVGKPDWFIKDCAPPYYALQVHHWLDQTFPGWWISRRGQEDGLQDQQI
jgi:hypothetical protein